MYPTTLHKEQRKYLKFQVYVTSVNSFEQSVKNRLFFWIEDTVQNVKFSPKSFIFRLNYYFVVTITGTWKFKFSRFVYNFYQDIIDKFWERLFLADFLKQSVLWINLSQKEIVQ
jgi:hypothetical protein